MSWKVATNILNKALVYTLILFTSCSPAPFFSLPLVHKKIATHLHILQVSYQYYSA